MAFIERLLKGGPHYQVEQRDRAISLKPNSGSADDIQAFQAVLQEAYEHEGEGYSVILSHFENDVTGLIDALLLQLEE